MLERSRSKNLGWLGCVTLSVHKCIEKMSKLKQILYKDVFYNFVLSWCAVKIFLLFKVTCDTKKVGKNWCR